MKLRLICIVAALLLIVGVHRTAQGQEFSGSPAQVCDSTDNLAGQFTDEYGNFIVFDHDECVVFVRANEQIEEGHGSLSDVAVAECKLEQAQGFYYYEDEGVTNFGQCVSFYEALFDSEEASIYSAPRTPWQSSPGTAIRRRGDPLYPASFA